MYIGIDFGTSYSAAAAVVDGQLKLIRFGDAHQFRTAVFFPEVVPNPEDFSLTPALAAQVDTIMRSARGQAGQGTEDQRYRDAVRVVRRQWMEEQTRAASSSIASFQHALFGEEAVEAYLEEGTGHLIESPKSMLGYRLDPPVRRTILNIAAHILEHIRLTATQQLGTPVRGAVIGRPVEFRSSMGESGGEQALELLREAAAIAGFDEVSFLEEPAAAAMHYHLSLAERQLALIVDIGGPLTEFSLDKGGSGGIDAFPNNVGGGLLKRFVVTFDYEHQLMYLKPTEGKVDDLDTFDRSGIWINAAANGFKIVDVSKGTPAADTGLRPDDVITAVDGKPVTSMKLYDLRKALRNDPPGTTLRLTINRKGVTQEMPLTLRDLI